jgi:hypothetical protein
MTTPATPSRTEDELGFPVAPGSRFDIERVGQPRPGGMAVYIWRDVLAELCRAAALRPEAFQTALLIGTVRDAAAGAGLLVQGYAELGTWTSESAFLEDTEGDWTLILNRLRRTNPSMRPLGWVCMRPDTGGALQPWDEFVHRSLFNLPFQVTLTIDGRDESCALWGPDALGYLVNIGFNLVTPRSRRPLSSEHTP